MSYASGRTGPATDPRAGGPRVLIVDDSLFLGQGMGRVLRTGGYETVATTNGNEAIELVQQSHFDVLITDLMMPQLSGEELIEQLQARVPSLPCVVVSGSATRELVLRVCRSPNVAAILVKPVSQDRLLSVLAATIMGKKQVPAGKQVVAQQA